MNIIDAHTHVFEKIAGFGPRGELRGIGNGKAQWANGDIINLLPGGCGDKEFTVDTLIKILDDNNVEKAVLLQGSFYGFQNGYVYDSLKKYPSRLIGAATLDPFCKNAEELLNYFINDLGFKIIKFEISSGGGLMGYHNDFSIDGSVFAPLLKKIADSGLKLVLDIGSPYMPSFQPKAIVNIAKRYTHMNIVICHLLAPTINHEEELKKALKMLVLPNVWFDLAAVPWNVAPEKYPYKTARKFLSIAKDIVGAQKLIWGTDVPSVLTKESYQGLIKYITEADIFNESQLEDVFYNNAKNAYGIK